MSFLLHSASETYEERTPRGRILLQLCREQRVFDDIGAAPPVLACLKHAERRATAFLRTCCCMRKGGGGAGSGYTILKGAAEYVPADFNGSV